MKSRKSVFPILLLITALTACSQGSNPTQTNNQTPVVSTPEGLKGPVISAGSIPSEKGHLIVLSDGSELFLQPLQGVDYYTVEGTFTRESFTGLMSPLLKKPELERKAIVSKEIQKIFSKLKDIGGVGLKQIPAVGYFKFQVPYPLNQSDFMAPLKAARLSQTYSFVLSPVRYRSNLMREIKALSPSSQGLLPRTGARDSSRGFSGLDSIHAEEFRKQAEADIGGGVEVNGSTVRVGVADSGVSLNHQNFLSKDSKTNRIDYMRDFSGEGRVYFNKTAKFDVIPSTEGAKEDLVINAQVILTPKLPKLPAGDLLLGINDFKIKVSPDLRAILTQSGSGAKLGFLDKGLFQSMNESVDLTGNGSLEGLIPMILIPGTTPEKDVVYVDPSGTGDFRDAKPLGDWNKTKATFPAMAERFGFDFQDDTLPSAKGLEPIQVRSASIVGLDPNNHGTHVSGIIAGRRTLLNDSENTLARGVAPEATLMVNRACSNNGGCISFTEAFTDLVVQGHADVVNLSLGGLTAFNDGSAFQSTLVDRLTNDYHTLFVTAAGNSGPGRQTVGIPSTARNAISVGATANREMIQRQYGWLGGNSGSESDQDFMLYFSSRGPTAAGGFKPNLTAPGTELSSVPINTAPGVRGGVDVMWGTSMAAPAVTGGYALLLDAVRKYNIQNPLQPLPSDVFTLRDVLVYSARPFDVSRFDPQTGEILKGQYTWIDQGMGMLDLVSAWKKLFELRDHPVPSEVTLAGKPVELDYQVAVLMKSPVGIPYDGSVYSKNRTPSFGEGVYLDYSDSDTLRQVNIIRKLPEKFTTDPTMVSVLGDLVAQLRTTREEFVLKTLIYGSDQPWVRAGVLDQDHCENSETSNLSLVGESASVEVKNDGRKNLNPLNLSMLNVCINRRMIHQKLKPGDHGALILGYRTVKGKVAVIPSFTVPVYLTVPHRQLANSTAYDVQQTVSNFGVKRNYVKVPVGATHVRVTLEVPTLKSGEDGLLLPGQSCSGVQLLPLLGLNIKNPYKSSIETVLMNCDANGRVHSDPDKRKLSFTIDEPMAGIWDLPVFGLYKYPKSQFKLRVDYVIATANVKEIKGTGLANLNGSMRLTLKEASFDMAPNAITSTYEITSLQSETTSKVEHQKQVFVPNLNGIMRSYPPGVQSVAVTTFGSSGNDIDLTLLECPKGTTEPTDPHCEQIGSSQGGTDEEVLFFVPESGKVYAVRVDGTSVKDEGNFNSLEKLNFESEKGNLSILEKNGVFDVNYSFSEAESRIVNHEYFKSGRYQLLGALTLRAKDKTVLTSIPIIVSSDSTTTETNTTIPVPVSSNVPTAP